MPGDIVETQVFRHIVNCVCFYAYWKDMCVCEIQDAPVTTKLMCAWVIFTIDSAPSPGTSDMPVDTV